MKRDGRGRPIQRVEMLSGDPRAFGPDAAGADPAPTKGASPRPHSGLIAVVVVVLVVGVAVAVGWPRSTGSSAPSSTSATVPSTIETDHITIPSQPTTPPGRDAPVPSSSVAFALTVGPSPVALGTPVTMQLTGDLSGVPSHISAVAWVDEQVSGVWRTIHWMARSSDTAQADGDVSDGFSQQGPDAITLGADQPVPFDVDVLTSGNYRLCRYVPLRAVATSSQPSTDPAYVCAQLVVDHTLFSAAPPTS